MAKVSIVIPCYNVQNYIELCLESVISQTYKDYEIIIVDDGSTDSTSAIINSFRTKHKDLIELKYIYQTNKGVSSARNRGIKESSGEYIAFIDSDDKWREDSLEKKMKLFMSNNISCVYSDVMLNYPNDNQISIKSLYGKLIKGNIYPEILEHNYININVVLKKTVLEDCGLFDETLMTCEDYDMWIRIASRGYLFDFVDIPLTYITIRESSLSRNVLQMYKDMIRVYDKVLKNTPAGATDYNIAMKRKKYFEKLFYDESFVNLVFEKKFSEAKYMLKKNKNNYNSYIKYYLKYLMFSIYPNYFYKNLSEREGKDN
jgi:glycosyltransferase involved in cell wall biosynthesis